MAVNLPSPPSTFAQPPHTPDIDTFYDAPETLSPAPRQTRARARPRPRLAHTRSSPHPPSPFSSTPVTRSSSVSPPPSPRARDAVAASNTPFVTGVAAPSIPRRYTLAADVFYAERAPQAEISIVKIAREAITGLKHGADITNVNLPATVLDPVSSLEKGMKSMQRGELLALAAREKAPRARFLRILAFYFSGLSKERFGKKPYNPVLGEVFRAAFRHRDGAGETVLVAEQVSHHPPVAALHLRNETLGFQMTSHAAPEPSFWGNSVHVTLKGCIRMLFEKWGEEYKATRPYIYMSGFLAGSHRLEFVGASEVVCDESGMAAEIEFKSKGLLGRGELNGVEGRVYDIASGDSLVTFAGTWDGVIKVTDVQTRVTSVLFDYADAEEGYSMCAVLPPEHEREPTYSSVVWAECSEWIWKSDTANANAAKRRVEDGQRRLRKERDATGHKWEPSYFEPRKDGEGYQLRAALGVQVGPDIVLDDAARTTVEKTQKFTEPAISVVAEVGRESGRLGRRTLLRKK